MCSCVAFEFCGSCVRGQCSCAASGKLHENGACFRSTFRGIRGHGRAFSKATSKTKTSWDLEQPHVGRRGLSTEREHCPKVNHTLWGCKVTFLSDSAGVRAQVNDQACIYFGLRLNAAANCHSSQMSGGDRKLFLLSSGGPMLGKSS